MRFRPCLFWLHLAAGLIAGLSIGIMCFTGTVLAFEKELVAWSERDARRIDPPAAGSPRLTLEQMQARLRAAHPDARPSAITLQNDPRAAVAFPTGRTGAYYVNPYTGEVRQAATGAMRDFMRLMTDWHRTLALGGDQRATGKFINGVCNLAFCLLAITGLYLWLPRSWSWRALRPIVWFRRSESGKARDFNWHNAIGLWTAPLLIMLTLTAVPISFRWGGSLINTLTSTPASAAGTGGEGRGGGPGGGPFGSGPAVVVPTPPAGATPLGPDALLSFVQEAVPTWHTITLRLAGAGPDGRGGPGGRDASAGSLPSLRESEPGQPEARGARTPRPPQGPSADTPRVTENRSTATGLQAVTFTVRSSTSWPRTATSTFAVDPFTGTILRRAGYAEMNTAQQVRSWTRFLHTGEALGWVGQFIAGLASLGGCFLVYTGFALSWRRFFSPRAASRVVSLERVPL